MNWEVTDEYINGTYLKPRLSNKIAAFDLDDTLITTKSKKKFAIDSNDWKLLMTNTIDKIKSLYDSGFYFVIITNQAGLKSDEKIEMWKTKVENILKSINIPCVLRASIAHNQYRKPNTQFLNTIGVDSFDSDSFYCGDAAGREGDHSDCDYKFALNAQLKFTTPEELFNNETITIPPIKYPFNIKGEFINQVVPKIKYKEKEMIIMVGFPGSGKSHYARALSDSGYVRVNNDELKTKAKCIKIATQTIEENKSLVIDNTNPSKSTRKQYIDIAKNAGYQVRCIHVTTSYDHARHNMYFRANTQSGSFIPELVYRKYQKEFEEPSTSEGFTEIICIPHTLIEHPQYRMYYF